MVESQKLLENPKSENDVKSLKKAVRKEWTKGRSCKKRALKLKIFRFLESSNSENKPRESNYYEWVIAALIISSLVLGMLNTMEGFNSEWLRITRKVTEVVLLLVLISEYALRIWSSSAHGTYGAAGGLKKYIVTPHMILDAFIILSSICAVGTMGMNEDGGYPRYLYLLQLMRALKFDRQRGAFLSFWKVFHRHSKELLTCWYMGFLMVVFVSFVVYALEGKRQTSEGSSRMDDLFNGVYWGVISLTTIGYGDIYPETPFGKVVICGFAIFGTCFLAMPAGIIGSGFALQVAEHQKEKHVNRQRRPAAVLLQSLWRKYAARNDLHATWIVHMENRQDQNHKRIQKSTMRRNGSGTSEGGKMPNGQETIFEEKIASPVPSPQPQRKDNKANMTQLTRAEKIALQFIRLLKCITATKKFRQARRPYDERDILDQFASSQIEMFAKVRDLKSRIESCSKASEHKITENKLQISQVVSKIQLIEKSVAENNILLHLLLHNQKKLLEKESEPSHSKMKDNVLELDEKGESSESVPPETDTLPISSDEIIKDEIIKNEITDDVSSEETEPTGTLSQAYFLKTDEAHSTDAPDTPEITLEVPQPDD